MSHKNPERKNKMRSSETPTMKRRKNINWYHLVGVCVCVWGGLLLLHNLRRHIRVLSRRRTTQKERSSSTANKRKRRRRIKRRRRRRRRSRGKNRRRRWIIRKRRIKK